MMTSLIDTRCSNHASREAAARCLVCRHYFCRECVTEHSGKVVCAACLRTQAESGLVKPGIMARSAETLAAVLAFLMIWFLVYLFGQILLSVPSAFHDGTRWETLWQSVP